MNADRPLAAAAERLRKRPGRPRKPRPETELPVFPAGRRLLDIEGAAEYLSLSPWTIRDLISAGTLRRVRIPLPNNGQVRRVLVDREDLDLLVTAWKDARP